VRGYVPTPPAIVDLMVEELFENRPPQPSDRILEPGCGTGAFIRGLIRWCERRGVPLPEILGVESNPDHVEECRALFGGVPQVTIQNSDFLRPSADRFQYIIGNPPYVPITGLTEGERQYYRREYSTARGRFDLYLLFWEQALRLLRSEGRMVFITPEKFLYLNTAAPLREIIAKLAIAQVKFVDETTFEGLVTYPVITTVMRRPANGPTRIDFRSGETRYVTLPRSRESWLPAIHGAETPPHDGTCLSDIALRVSCGVATGADAIFVEDHSKIAPDLHEFARPTVAGREIKLGNHTLTTKQSMLLPYDASGRLLPESRLGPLGAFLGRDDRRMKLLGRTCVPQKPWYAFHETPPLAAILRPKILCKDISPEPFFIVDHTGEVVPRHSVYYIVPRDPSRLTELAEYLNSASAREWLHARCPRAANGFLRLQAHVLKALPMPHSLASSQRPNETQLLLSA
jgi:hypothetical protein